MTSLKTSLGMHAGPKPQDEGTPSLSLLQLIYPTIYTVQLQCLHRAPGCRLIDMSQILHTYCRSVRNRVLNPGYLRGRERHYIYNRSAIHYD
jgi:hypothetical protein